MLQYYDTTTDAITNTTAKTTTSHCTCTQDLGFWGTLLLLLLLPAYIEESKHSKRTNKHEQKEKRTG